MKNKFVIFLLVFVALFFAFNVSFWYMVKKVIRDDILPSLEKRTTLHWSYSDLSWDLFNMTLNIKDINVDNPAGFVGFPYLMNVSNGKFKIGIDSLFEKDKLVFKKVVCDDLKLNIVRNVKGDINIAPLLNITGGSVKQNKPSDLSLEKGDSIFKVNGLSIDLLKIKGKISYFDYALFNRELLLDLSINLMVNNLTTYGPPSILTTSFSGNGNIDVNNEKVSFNVKGRCSPLYVISNMSFEIYGSIEKINVASFKEIFKGVGLEGGNVYASFMLVCTSGKFDENKSYILLTFNNPVLNEEKRNKMGGIPLPDSFSVTIPVYGTLEKPYIDFLGAFQRTITSEDMINKILNKIMGQNVNMQ